jgi:4-amino-4-deoxy-L-arabinose transferase-like glycosyltransferase
MNQSLVRDRGQHGLLQTTTPLLLLLVLLASFGLRVYRLGDKSVWWDEGLAAWSARQSLVEIAQWTSADVHPPLYFWMLHFWRQASGDSEFGLRTLSVAIGVLTVAATYLLASEVGSRAAGLLAAALVALSRFDVWWSQEMRMYALAALWAVLALWAAVRFWDRGRWMDAGLYTLFVTAGLYTLYLSVSVLVVANMVWLWVWWRAKERKRTFVRWVVAQLAALMLFGPWLLYALGRMPTWSSASPVALGVFLRVYWTVLVVGIPIEVERYLWITLPVLAIFVAGLVALLVRARRDGRAGRNVALLLLALLLPAGVVYLVSLPRETFFYSPQLAPRYLLLFAPAFYVLLAWGVSVLGTRRLVPLRVLLAVLVLGIAAYGLWTYYSERILVDDYKSLAATLRAYERSDDAVVLYTDRDWPVFAYHHPGPWHKVPHALRVTPENAQAYLSPVWEAHQGVWLAVTPYAGVNDPQGEVPAWLAARAASTVEYRFSDKVLRFYARTAERAGTARQLVPGFDPPQSLQTPLGLGVLLTGYEQPVPEYRNGDTIHLFLHLEGQGDEQRAIAGLEASLVHEPEGSHPPLAGEPCSDAQAWNRVRTPLPESRARGSRAREQVDLVVPPDMPAGRYTFALRPLPGEEAVCIGAFALRPWPRTSLANISVTETAIARPREVDFDDGVRLLGYDLGADTLAPGDTLYLTLYWQASRPVEHRYKVFTHVLGEVYNDQSRGFLWGQQDNEPVSGARPTSTWRSDEVIVDDYAILLDPGAPPGDYSIEIGLYDPATLERLSVLDDRGQAVADHLVLVNVQVTDD